MSKLKEILNNNHTIGAIVTIIATALIVYIPDLAPLKENLIVILTTIIGFALAHAGAQAAKGLRK